MKISKSSKECAAYNEANKGCIEAGLMESWEPTDAILEQEKQEVARKQHVEREEAEKAQAMALFAGLNPNGVRLSLEKTYSGSGWRYQTHTGWRLIIGDGYGRDANKTWAVVGVGTSLKVISSRQLSKVREKIQQVAAVMLREQAQRSARMSVAQRTNAFAAANPEFCAMVGHSSYNSGETIYSGSGYNRRPFYQTSFFVNEDGSVCIGGQTFTVEQWKQIYALRAEHAAAMKSLMEGFVAANKK